MRMRMQIAALSAIQACVASTSDAQEVDYSAAMAAIVENIKIVCQAPAERGKSWSVTATGAGQAKLIIKLIDLGVSGAIEFNKEEWEGVQRVLREHQAEDNRNYRECARELTPLFVQKFSANPILLEERLKQQESINKSQYIGIYASHIARIKDVVREKCVSYVELQKRYVPEIELSWVNLSNGTILNLIDDFAASFTNIMPDQEVATLRGIINERIDTRYREYPDGKTHTCDGVNTFIDNFLYEDVGSRFFGIPLSKPEGF